MSILFNELTTGPLAEELAPLIASGEDKAIEAVLRDKSRFTKYGWISVADFETWSSKYNEEYVNIESHAANTASPIYAAANTILRRLNQNNTEGSINIGASEVMYLMDNWPFVDQTGTSKTDLLALGTFPASREDIIGINCSSQNIAQALRG